MSSRDKILSAIKNSQPDFRELPPLGGSGFSGSPLAGSVPGSPAQPAFDASQAFINVLESIGGRAYIVAGFDRIATIIREQFPDARRIVSNCPELTGATAEKPAFAEKPSGSEDPHTMENIDLAVLPAHFGVAENGACWITDDCMIERVIPFICQHLALVIDKQHIVATMHQAYDRIAEYESAGNAYDFATFIAGPSKTADIEQSLVLGAHGPKSLTVFLMDQGISDAGFF